MKDLKQSLMFVLLMVTTELTQSGCSQVEFTPSAVKVSQATDSGPTFITPGTEPIVPPTPTPLPPPFVIVPGAPVIYQLSDGVCNSNSSTQILSCLKCEIPKVIPKPQLSLKAQALMDSMYLACQVSNLSDHNNLRPTQAMILNKLNRASENIYPESPRTAMISTVIQGLTNPIDNSLRIKMFGGLWYQPPYSDAFETYFGMTVQEAKSTFCWNGDQMNGIITDQTGVASKDFIDCQYSSLPFLCQELPAYVTAQTYRAQLKSALQLGVTNPYTTPVPDPSKICSWKKFQGNDMAAAKAQLTTWQSAGLQVSMTVTNSTGNQSCGIANAANLVNGFSVEMGTYSCQ
jgi:hypothetical protein